MIVYYEVGNGSKAKEIAAKNGSSILGFSEYEVGEFSFIDFLEYISKENG